MAEVQSGATLVDIFVRDIPPLDYMLHGTLFIHENELRWVVANAYSATESIPAYDKVHVDWWITEVCHTPYTAIYLQNKAAKNNTGWDLVFLVF